MMNTTLWIVQGLLALVFLMTGIMKLLMPKEKAVERAPYVEDFSQGQLRAIGVAEILGALGLILPELTGILPWLTPLAAAGLALIMVGALLTHIRRKEYGNAVFNLVLMALAAFVLVGRLFLV